MVSSFGTMIAGKLIQVATISSDPWDPTSSAEIYNLWSWSGPGFMAIWNKRWAFPGHYHHYYSRDGKEVDSAKYSMMLPPGRRMKPDPLPVQNCLIFS